MAGTPLDFRSFRTIGEGIGTALCPTAGDGLRAGTGSVNVPEPGTGYGTELRAATGTRTGEEVGPGTGPGIGPDPYGIRVPGGYDHPFPIDGWQPSILAEAAELRDPQSGRRVEVLTSQPCVVLYTGNRLAGGCPEAKSGGRYADHAGVMLECQHYPDAVHHPEFPSPLLREGEL